MEAAGKCLLEAENQLSGNEYILTSQLVMDKVSRSNCSSYDCEYVALADDLGCHLITSDKQILKEFPGLAINLKEFA